MAYNLKPKVVTYEYRGIRYDNRYVYISCDDDDDDIITCNMKRVYYYNH